MNNDTSTMAICNCYNSSTLEIPVELLSANPHNYS